MLSEESKDAKLSMMPKYATERRLKCKQVFQVVEEQWNEDGIGMSECQERTVIPRCRNRGL